MVVAPALSRDQKRHRMSYFVDVDVDRDVAIQQQAACIMPPFGLQLGRDFGRVVQGPDLELRGEAIR